MRHNEYLWSKGLKTLWEREKTPAKRIFSTLSQTTHFRFFQTIGLSGVLDFYNIFELHKIIIFQLNISKITHFRSFQTESLHTTILSLMKKGGKGPKRVENTVEKKEKLFVKSNFSFFHSVFRRLLSQARKNKGLFGKRLNAHIFRTLNTSADDKLSALLKIKAKTDDK